MAVFDKLREFWETIPFVRPKPEPAIPFIEESPPESASMFAADYKIYSLTLKHLDEVDVLDRRCFTDGEAYTRSTIEYLLGEPNLLAFRAVERKTGEMVAFIITMLEKDGTGHITTIGVAPGHRRRGLAYRLLEHTENAFRQRSVRMMRLEVRVDNKGAQDLYRRAGYSVMQRVNNYYANGGDALLMAKAII